MQVEYLKESEVPSPPKAPSKAAAAILKILSDLKEGQVAKITPDEGQSIRGLKTSFGRVSKGNGQKVQTWSIDSDNPQVLYVKKIK